MCAVLSAVGCMAVRLGTTFSLRYHPMSNTGGTCALIEAAVDDLFGLPGNLDSFAFHIGGTHQWNVTYADMLYHHRVHFDRNEMSWPCRISTNDH